MVKGLGLDLNELKGVDKNQTGSVANFKAKRRSNPLPISYDLSIYQEGFNHIHLFHPNFKFVVRITISSETEFIHHFKTWCSFLYIVRVLQLVKSCTGSTEIKCYI